MKNLAHFELSVGDKDNDNRVDVSVSATVFGFNVLPPQTHNLDMKDAFGIVSGVAGLVKLVKDKIGL